MKTKGVGKEKVPQTLNETFPSMFSFYSTNCGQEKTNHSVHIKDHLLLKHSLE